MHAEQRGAYLSALFVDYDNVYLSLRRRSEEAAARFAQAPSLWMEQIVHGRLIRRETTPRVQHRRLAIDRVYGNPVPRRAGRENDPNSFIFVRHHFIRAGFEVIDCPPLTAQLKNGSDIRMAIDVRDLIEHRTRFDEFILLSGDADFTPVLHRLREYDREVIIYANDHTAQPYTALCDGRIEERDFVDFLLSNALPAPEGHAERRPLGATDPGTDTARAVGQAVHRALGYDDGPEQMPAGFPPAARDAAPAATGGSGSLPSRSTQPRTEEPAIRALMDDFRQIGAEILDLVVKSVADADKPVPIAYLANRAMKEIGSEKTVGTNWAGSGGFLNFLSRNLPDHLRLSEAPPHCVYDPARHSVEGGAREEQGMSTPARSGPPAPAAEAGGQRRSDLQRSITRIYEASKAPPLPPSEYQLLFSLVAEEVQDNGFRTGRTASAVIARGEENGVRFADQDVSFVLSAVDDVDPCFERVRTPQRIAQVYRDVILNRCRKGGLDLSDDERQLIDVWFGAAQLGAGAEPVKDSGVQRHAHHSTGRPEIPLPPDFDDAEGGAASPGSALRDLGGAFKRGG